MIIVFCLLLFLQTFDSWRDRIPDMKWLKDYAPSDESMQDWRDQFRRLGKNVQLPDLPRPKNVSTIIFTRMHWSIIL